jgi:AcrR family transcriptional regulator
MTAVPAPVPGRADARRNRELVLRTATRVFAEDGLEVSLGRIARRAGVGAGTVYRHFPSKQVLVEAVLTEHFDAMVAAADRWAARAAPGDALIGFLVEVVETSAGRQPVCDALGPDHGWPHATLTAATRRFREALDRLLRGAQRAGAVRAEMRADDLSALLAGAAALRSAHPSRARGMRLVRVLLDGLRTAPVTTSGPFRDTPGDRRHGTGGAGHCGECGAPLRMPAAGRPPRYCGATCRQRAHRRRQRETNP